MALPSEPKTVIEHKLRSPGSLVGEQFIDFDFMVLADSQTVKLSDFVQQAPFNLPVVVCFYASWWAEVN